MSSSIKFIKYTGEYPCLCSGMLVICFEGKEYGVTGWISGGSVWFDDDWNDYTSIGDWSIDINDLPVELQPYHHEIVKVMNENVQKGCCGGCI